MTPNTEIVWIISVISVARQPSWAPSEVSVIAPIRALARYDALLKVLQIIAAQRDLKSLVSKLAQELHKVLEFCNFDLLLYDPDLDRMTLYFPGVQPFIADYIRFSDGPGYWAWQNQRTYVGVIDELERQFPVYAESRRDEHIKVFCCAPLTTLNKRLGVVHFSSSVLDRAYDADELEFIQRMAAQIAILIESTANAEAARALESELTRERNHLRDLLEVTNAAVSQLELDDMLREIQDRLCSIARCRHVNVALEDEPGILHWQSASSLAERDLFVPGSPLATDGLLLRGARLSPPRAEVLEHNDLNRAAVFSQEVANLVDRGIRTVCLVPLASRDRLLGLICFNWVDPGACSADRARMLAEIAGQLAPSIENALVHREVSRLRDRLAEEKLCLEEELRSEHNFNEMIGESPALHRVLAQIEQVAASDSTVLILGETGVGKELAARAIHQLSLRTGNAMLKLNCSAIPAGLLESELFGHERGAFTGAVARKLGRMELADRGSLFLDEIGDIPLELQPKLLRVLQEHEFERVGGRATVRSDFRLIAATNRNLREMVADHTFRSDLFYRLNVFPIVVPPLRERREDIPLLVRHFVRKYARRMNRRIDTIPSETMSRLAALPWPGNIRELENLVERAVILTHGSVLAVPAADLVPANDFVLDPTPSLDQLALASPGRSQQQERAFLIKALEESGGRVSGPNGAAVRLGMPRSTLFSRLQTLGINPREIRSACRVQSWQQTR